MYKRQTQHQMEKKDGYQHGLNPGLEVLRKAKEYGVAEITYYGFTVDNCKRPKEMCIRDRTETVQIVTGAKNVFEGAKVPVVLDLSLIHIWYRGGCV